MFWWNQWTLEKWLALSWVGVLSYFFYQINFRISFEWKNIFWGYNNDETSAKTLQLPPFIVEKFQFLG